MTTKAMATTSISSFSYPFHPTSYILRARGQNCWLYYGVVAEGSRRRLRWKAVRATQDGGRSSITGSNQGGAPQPQSSFSETINWLFGSIFLAAIPIWRRIQNAGDALQKADDAVERIELIADKVGDVAREIADELPDGSGVKCTVLKVLKVAEKVEEGADKLDNVLDKISDSLDMLNDSSVEKEGKRKGEVVQANAK